MKKNIGWILGGTEIGVGFVMLVSSLIEISTNSRYTWSRPYTSYELQVITLKWAGIMLLVSGLIWIGTKLFQSHYVNNHIKDVTELTQMGGAVKCANCGLSVTADISNCPRCGTAVSNSKNLR